MKKLYLLCNAHLDPVWLWGKREGIAETISTFRVAADGFLYNMVRIMAGTLLEVARGNLAPEEITAVTESRDRRRAGATAPAHGLYLNHVSYEEYGKEK